MVKFGWLVTDTVTQFVRTGSTKPNVRPFVRPKKVVIGASRLHVSAFSFVRLSKNESVTRTLLLIIKGSTREMLPTRLPQISWFKFLDLFLVVVRIVVLLDIRRTGVPFVSVTPTSLLVLPTLCAIV